MNHLSRIINGFLLAGMLLSNTAGIGAAHPQVFVSAEAVLDEMTPEQKVGQLFIISASLDQLGEDGPIYDLVENYHIGGILLKPGTVMGQDYSSEEFITMISDLQQYRWDISHQEIITDQETESAGRPEYIPLFISSNLDSHQDPLLRVFEESTYIPSHMAIGATWDTSMAFETGRSVGEQLSFAGVNMFFGPTLDVLDDAVNSRLHGIGVRSFGGDPYWVGLMGESYIEGLHSGSEGGVAVISRHFPGLGSSDRPMTQEVATIRKSLEQLKQIELAPFFSVTDGIPGEDPSITDGLLVGHIRYQGFQGNIRATTKPISLDGTALSQIMDIKPFVDWRQSGGLIISDSLGYDSIKRFVETTGRAYSGHIVARNAFLAGSDMMILSDINTDPQRTEYEAVSDVLTFFAQKYREDDVFAQQVDDSVSRILDVKLRLYNGDFDIAQVLKDQSDFINLSRTQDISVNAARSALTLISPADFNELEERTGGAPQAGDRLVIFTDSRSSIACIPCLSSQGIGQQDFEDAVIRLYGPGGAGLINRWQIDSFTTVDLAAYLQQPSGTSLPQELAPVETIDDALREADWIVFFVLDPSNSQYGSTALIEFLENRSDLIREKLVVVFSAGTPFGLDATEFSKVDAFYSLYSYSAPFIEAAARVLFLEMAPGGASPVSIPGVGYDLILATSPNPDQIIPLRGKIEGVFLEDFVDFEPNPGELIELIAGPVLDINGHVVPDKTPVDFYLIYQGETSMQTQLSATTVGGIAQLIATIERSGVLTIRAESSGAISSDSITLNVPMSGPLDETAVPDEISVAEVQITPDVSIVPDFPNTDNLEIRFPRRMGATGLAMGLLGLAISGAGVILIGSVYGIRREMIFRYLLIVLCGSLLFYNYLSLGLPGSNWLVQRLGSTSGLVVSAGGGFLTNAIVILRDRVVISDKGRKKSKD